MRAQCVGHAALQRLSFAEIRGVPQNFDARKARACLKHMPEPIAAAVIDDDNGSQRRRLDQFAYQIDEGSVRAKRRNYHYYGPSKSHDTVAGRGEIAPYVTMTNYQA